MEDGIDFQVACRVTTSSSATFCSLCPSVDDLLDGLVKGDCDVPIWEMASHLLQITVVADVVAFSMFVYVFIFHGASSFVFNDSKGL